MLFKRGWLTAMVLLLGWAPLQAHFLWLIPVGTNQAKLIFSDSLKPDDPALMDKVKDVRFFGHNKADKHIDLKYTKGDDGFMIDLPKEMAIVAGTCTYGVFQRGEGKPMLLQYNVLLHLDDGHYPCEHCMPLQIRMEKAGQWQVIWEGEPVADCEVHLIGPDGVQRQVKKTDKSGQVMWDWGAMPAGVYGLRVGQVSTEGGEHDGKKYDEQRFYTTLVFKKS